MLRRRTVTAGCALAISVLTLMAAPAVADRASAAAPAAPPPAPAMIDAMSRDLGISREQAESRLLNEARFMGVESSATSKLGGSYAGSWLSGPTSSGGSCAGGAGPTSATLTVAGTDAAALTGIQGSGVQAKVVAHSLASLEAAKAALDKASAQAPAPGP